MTTRIPTQNPEEPELLHRGHVPLSGFDDPGFSVDRPVVECGGIEVGTVRPDQSISG